MPLNKWGYTAKIGWALVQKAPLTASGLNEIVMCAQYRSMLLPTLKDLGRGYAIVKWSDIPRIPKEPKEK